MSLTPLRSTPLAPAAGRYGGPDPQLVSALGQKPLAKMLVAHRDAVTAEQEAERHYLAALAPDGADFVAAVAEDAAAILAGNGSAGAAEAVLADQDRRLADWHTLALVARWRQEDLRAAAVSASPALSALATERLAALDSFIPAMPDPASREVSDRLAAVQQEAEADRLRRDYWAVEALARWASDPAKGHLDQHGPKPSTSETAWPYARLGAESRARLDSLLGIRRIIPVVV